MQTFKYAIRVKPELQTELCSSKNRIWVGNGSAYVTEKDRKLFYTKEEAHKDICDNLQTKDEEVIQIPDNNFSK